ncbi:MAG: PhoH family protein [Oscillospiraceae bacterium]|nr:PhoH family protein [Oscillospiraceae bacterium]
MNNTIERVVNAERVEDLIAVFGSFDENIKRIEESLGVTIVNRGTELKVSGEAEAADKAARTLEGLLSLAAKGEIIDEQRVRYLITLVQEGNDALVAKMAKDVVCITAKGKPIKAKTVGQQDYMKAIQNNTVTIGVGPAGTGKTYLAVAAAVAAFRERTVNRIILTRPAVEAGERLGFLPGDLQNKVDPYLRPLYDALYDMLGAETFQKYQERGSIEVAPLAYMRGRTLDDSFIILDEAQNTTREQMKMFLTRLGFGSKIVITGDVTQIDLPDDKISGLKDAVRVLEGVKDIAVCKLTSADVVRHALVQQIINAYEKAEKKKEEQKSAQNYPGRTQRKK